MGLKKTNTQDAPASHTAELGNTIPASQSPATTSSIPAITAKMGTIANSVGNVIAAALQPVVHQIAITAQRLAVLGENTQPYTPVRRQATLVVMPPVAHVLPRGAPLPAFYVAPDSAFTASQQREPTLP